MYASLVRRRRLLQVVLVALLAAALVPTLARAYGSWISQVAPWGEVCTTTAERSGVAVDPTDTRLVHPLEHCPMCSVQFDGPALLPGASAALVPPALRGGQPPQFFASQRTASTWAPAHARAPPDAP